MSQVTSSPVSRCAQDVNAAVLQLEQQLAGLLSAMCRQDPLAIELAAGSLHKSLATALDLYSSNQRLGQDLTPPLRQRLIAASGQVAALREALARATASLDRAIDVLLPQQAALGVYGASGASARTNQGAMRA